MATVRCRVRDVDYSSSDYAVQGGNMPKHLLNSYGVLLTEIKARVRSAQYSALKAVNKELIGLYWDIGRIIEERQKGGTWGKSVVEQLAGDLQKEFPGMHGFSPRNIWRMRDFYLTYCGNTKVTPLVSEIGWSHNLLILTGCGIHAGLPACARRNAGAAKHPHQLQGTAGRVALATR